MYNESGNGTDISFILLLLGMCFNVRNCFFSRRININVRIVLLSKSLSLEVQWWVVQKDLSTTQLLSILCLTPYKVWRRIKDMSSSLKHYFHVWKKLSIHIYTLTNLLLHGLKDSQVPNLLHCCFIYFWV